MTFSISWLCSRSTKNMILKIVHPGGHVELHDHPLLAAEIMNKNPKCLVTYPHVFQQPWAIVAPDTMLMLGNKFYVVPISTIRKLQMHSLKHSTSLLQDVCANQSGNVKEEKQVFFTCGLFVNQTISTRRSNTKEIKKERCISQDSCFIYFLTCGFSKAKGHNSKMNKSHESKGKIIESPKRLSSFDYWQPTLEIIKEE